MSFALSVKDELRRKWGLSLSTVAAALLTAPGLTSESIDCAAQELPAFPPKRAMVEGHRHRAHQAAAEG